MAKSRQDIKVIGHRGCVLEPENTLPAFRYALEHGADGIEFDVQLTSDNVPVIIHDEMVDRTTDGEGPVSGFTLQQIRTLKVKYADGRIADEVVVPTLEEVLGLVEEFRSQRQLTINVEIKSLGAAPKTMECLKYYVSKKGWNYDDFLVSSFIHDELRFVKREAPEFPLGVLYEPEDEPTLAEIVEELAPYSINPSITELKSKICDPGSFGRPMICWIGGEKPYPDNMAGILKAIEKGAEVIITNYPKEVKEAILSKEYKSVEQCNRQSHVLSGSRGCY